MDFIYFEDIGKFKLSLLGNRVDEAVGPYIVDFEVRLSYYPHIVDTFSIPVLIYKQTFVPMEDKHQESLLKLQIGSLVQHLYFLDTDVILEPEIGSDLGGVFP